MRVHIKRNRRNKCERSHLLLPSVWKQHKDRAIKYEWIHQNIIPEETAGF